MGKTRVLPYPPFYSLEKLDLEIDGVGGGGFGFFVHFSAEVGKGY